MSPTGKDEIRPGFEAHGIRLVCTCEAVPEQYDAFDGAGQQVGYLRLRNGRFTVDCPDAMGGEEIWRIRFRSSLKGAFFTPREREWYLARACERIADWARRRAGE